MAARVPHKGCKFRLVSGLITLRRASSKSPKCPESIGHLGKKNLTCRLPGRHVSHEVIAGSQSDCRSSAMMSARFSRLIGAQPVLSDYHLKRTARSLRLCRLACCGAVKLPAVFLGFGGSEGLPVASFRTEWRFSGLRAVCRGTLASRSEDFRFFCVETKRTKDHPCWSHKRQDAAVCLFSNAAAVWLGGSN